MYSQIYKDQFERIKQMAELGKGIEDQKERDAIIDAIEQSIFFLKRPAYLIALDEIISKGIRLYPSIRSREIRRDEK